MASAMLFAVLCSLCLAPATCDCDPDKFEEVGIVPNILSNVPEAMKVLYPDHPVDCGDDVDVALTKNAPMVNYTAEDTEFYSLLMLDPDAPDPHRPVFAHFLHWLVVNVPGNRVEKGKVLTPYMQPSPPPYSAAHRYLLVALHQQRYLSNPTYMTGRGRSRFDAQHAGRALNATEVAAANFFYARK